MSSNLDKYKSELNVLCKKGSNMMGSLEDDLEDCVYADHSFLWNYEDWYSKSRAVLKQILPDRLEDFENYYEIKNRKKIDEENYSIRDYLIGLKKKDVLPSFFDPQQIVVNKFKQQIIILHSAKERLDSSLYDIQQIVKADLFDSELEATRELLKHGFLRPAGTVAGVILEKHLRQVSVNHNISIKKKDPTISDFNDMLKDAQVFDVPVWRKIQHLGDLRNFCAHNKGREPTKDEVTELIDETDKIIKTIS